MKKERNNMVLEKCGVQIVRFSSHRLHWILQFERPLNKFWDESEFVEGNLQSFVLTALSFD